MPWLCLWINSGYPLATPVVANANKNPVMKGHMAMSNRAKDGIVVSTIGEEYNMSVCVK